MLVPFNNHLNISRSPHSLGLQHDVTVPVPYADNNWFIKNEKAFLSAGLQGLGCSKCDGSGNGLGDISTDLTGLMDTISNMSMWDWIGIIGIVTVIYFWTESNGKGKESGRSTGRRRSKRKLVKVEGE